MNGWMDIATDWQRPETKDHNYAATWWLQCKWNLANLCNLVQLYMGFVSLYIHPAIPTFLIRILLKWLVSVFHHRPHINCMQVAAIVFWATCWVQHYHKPIPIIHKIMFPSYPFYRNLQKLNSAETDILTCTCMYGLTLNLSCWL